MKKEKKVRILIILILLSVSVGMTYSLYFSSGELATTNQNIAKFVFNADEVSTIEVLLDLVPGESQDYLFSVSNNENEVISDVTIEYQIIIKTYHFIPLEINLYKLNGEEENYLSNCDETFTRNEENVLICNVPIQTMSYKKEELDDYKLEVIFPIEYNSDSYAGMIDYIDLEIKSWQKT